jgi:hypothetical protein
MSNEPIEIIITVLDGVASPVTVPENVTITVRDYDVEGIESSYPPLTTDEDGEDCIISTYTH